MSASQQPWQMTATDLVALVKSRRLSPVEIVQSVLARIDEMEPKLNAFTRLDAEGAMASAREAEAAVMRGEHLGSLHGVPIGIKDMQSVRGLPTRRGSRLTDPSPAVDDSPSVERMRKAGGIILGKTTATEQGWTAVSDSPLSGATHNPWKSGHTSGGSSSGAAALAAAGCGPLHLGTDGAGSVRLPSHFCGTVGFKPTFGTVPYVPTPNNGALSHIGPIARTVADAELMLEAMGGPHPLDATTHAAGFQRKPRRDLRGLRIAYSPDLGHARVDAEVAQAVASAMRTFEDLGAHVEQVTPSWGTLGPDLIRSLWGPALVSYIPKDEAAANGMDQGFRACLEETARVSWPEVSAAQGRRLAYAAAVADWFASGWDLLVTPAASVVAFPHGRQRPDHWPPHAWDWLVWAEFSYPFNLSHGPAVSVPCAISKDGLPIGLQIAGTRFADNLVMDAAAAFQAATPLAPSWQ